MQDNKIGSWQCTYQNGCYTIVSYNQLCLSHETLFLISSGKPLHTMKQTCGDKHYQMKTIAMF